MRNRTKKTDRGTAFKIRLRGKDGVPLSMNEVQQGLLDIARKLKPYGAYRAKWATLYITIVDEHGDEVRLNNKGEWVLYPYKSAAEEAGL